MAGSRRHSRWRPGHFSRALDSRRGSRPDGRAVPAAGRRAAASVLARGLADVVLIGADRIAANSDTANKVGSFSLALAARHAGVPFLVVAPETTLDPATPDGGAIEVEERRADEVTGFRGTRAAPAGTRTLNPAFDVTPASLITAIVTDAGDPPRPRRPGRRLRVRPGPSLLVERQDLGGALLADPQSAADEVGDLLDFLGQLGPGLGVRRDVGELVRQAVLSASEAPSAMTTRASSAAKTTSATVVCFGSGDGMETSFDAAVPGCRLWPGPVAGVRAPSWPRYAGVTAVGGDEPETRRRSGRRHRRLHDLARRRDEPAPAAGRAPAQ